MTISPPVVPGPVTSFISTDGSISLVQVGNDYFLYGVGTTNGPELMYAGSPVAAGQFPGWTLIGAEQTAGGYEVALKNAGANR